MHAAHGLAQMQPVIDRYGRTGQQALARVLGPHGVRGRDGVPRRALGQRPAPFGDAALAVMDLLPAAEQADDDRPIAAPGHDVEQVPGLRGGQRDRAVAGFPDRVRGGPAALRLVDDQHALGRGVRLPHVVVAEPGQGLDHPFHPLLRRPPRHAAPGGVPHQGLPQNMHQRRVAGQERGARAGKGEVEAAQRLAGAGLAGHEHHAIPPFCLSAPDRFRDGSRGAREAAAPGLSQRQCRDVMAGIKQACRLHQGRTGR